ncbi:MAG: ABC transporter permease [Phycisphaerae bacterium]|nr:ABC transporter permease [Phycisphaerae bacterium]NUQ47751.1 ABC transporter permease [Phycisphaerae bacterium]
MHRVWTMALKDLHILRRDRMGLFWVLIFPLVYATFFGLIMSGMGKSRRGIPIAVFDQDRSEGSRAFVDELKKSDGVELREYPGVDDARADVRKGKIVAYAVVKKGFGDSWGFFGGEAPPLEIGIDPSRKAEEGMLQGMLLEATFRSMAERFSNPAALREKLRGVPAEIDGDADLDPIQRQVLKTFIGSLDVFLGSIDPKVYAEGGPRLGGDGGMRLQVTEIDAGRKFNPFEITFPSAILWAILGCSAGFAIGLVKERAAGTLLRLQLAPVTRMQVLAGKGLACFLTCCVVITLLLAFGATCFDVRISRPFHLALGALSVAVCFVGIMMLMSTLGKTEQSVAGAGWGFNTVMAMIGGGMVPLMFMPDWMLTIGSISPVKWSILALEGAIWRDYSLGDMMLPCGILLCIGVAGFAGGSRLFASRE